MAKQKSKLPSYEEALEELQSIVNRLQEETIGIDQLSENIRRAAELIDICKTKLRTTEADINKLFEEN